ncbi:MAG: hypothetical protein M0R38_04955 [Bacteroidia bacterium]|nr:hypothetical protein [Bacteroidia bacterium]
MQSQIPYFCRIELYLQYSYWWLVVILMITGVATWWLYPKAKGNSKTDILFCWIKRVCRFGGLFLLLLLLLSPVLKFLSHEQEKPLLLFYLDDSHSIKAVDSVAATQFHQQWEQFADHMQGDFDVRKFYFTSEVKDSFSGFNGRKTRMEAPTEYTRSAFKRKNTGAMIVASDGILNAGINPVYAPLGDDIAVFTVGLGDSTQKRDVLVKEVNHNSLVFLNNAFTVVAHIQAFGFEGKSVKVSLLHGGNEIQSSNLTFSSSNDYKTIEFVANADKPGYQRYAVQVSALEEEQTLTNNQKDFFVEVIDGREKILLLYQSPHPDVNAMASALAGNKNFEVKTMFAQDAEEADLKDVSLVIGNQFPSRNNKDAKLMTLIRNKKIAFWGVIGGQSPVDQLSVVLPELSIVRRGNSWNEAQLSINSHFNAFSFSEKLLEQLPDWSPLFAPFGQYRSKSNMEVLGYQAISKIATEYPLIAFTENDGVKSAWTFGEGVWRWRINDYARNNSPELFDELFNKIARFLMIKEDKRRFRVYPIKNEFEEDESVRFQGELFNQNFEPIQDAEIVVSLTNEAGKDFTFRMSNAGANAGYDLDAGNFEVGYYKYSASVTGRTEFEKVKGGFLIKPLQIELTQLRADFGLLREWAAKSDGAFFNRDQWDELEKAIRNDPRIKPLIKTKTKIEELIKIENLLLIIALLFGLEWFMRKWEGAY